MVDRRVDRFVALVAVVALAGTLALVAPAAEVGADDGSPTPGGAAPLWCDGESSMGGAAGLWYGLAWVPSGASARLMVRDVEMLPTRYGGAGQVQYVFTGSMIDTASGLDLWSDWGFAQGAIFQPAPFPWIPHSDVNIGTWVNSTGSSAAFLVEIHADRGFAGGGVKWSLDVEVTGGNGDPAPVCDGDWFADSEMFGVNPALRHQCPCQNTEGDPIDTRSGNLHMPLPGISVAGRGPGLSFDLAYNSLDIESTGALGSGWSSTLDVELRENPDGSRTVVQEQGSTVRFVPAGGGWEAPARMSASLVENLDGSFTFERNHRERFSFDSNGRLGSLADRFGNETVLTYPSPSSREATTMEDGAGQLLSFSWSGGRLVAVTDGLTMAEGGPRSLDFTYDGDDLVEYGDVSGGVWTMGYDDHRMVSFRKPRHAANPSAAVTNEFDSRDRVVGQEDELGNRTSFAYDAPAAGSTRITMPGGEVRIDRYVDKRRVETVYAVGTAEEVSVLYEYDPVSWGPVTVTDERGEVWRYGYDAVGNRTFSEDPLGRIDRWEHDSLDQVVTASSGEVRTGPSTTDTSEQVVTRLSYDPSGLLVEAVVADGTPSGSTTEYAYEDLAHPEDMTSLTDPRGKEWVYGYDADTGVVVSASDPLGHTATWSYNSIGWTTSYVSPKGNELGAAPGDFETTYEHNLRGQVTEVVNPSGDIERSEFDANGNLVEVASDLSAADPVAEVTAYTYDLADRLVGRDEPGPGSVSYEYDADGRRTAVVNENGNRWEYGYDVRGRLVAETDPQSRVTGYGYDEGANLVSVIQPSSGSTCAGPTPAGCTTYTYDEAGQLTGVAYSDPSTPDVGPIVYDVFGRRTAATSGSVTEAWTWDELGRLREHTDANGRMTTYGWDAASNLTSIGYPGQTVPVTRTFDDAGHMASITDWAGRVTSFTYDPNSNWTGTTFPSGTSNVDVRTYDASDRLGSVTWKRGSTTLGSLTYGLDDEGMAGTASATGSALPMPAEYGYDDRDRLTSVDSSVLAVDPAGNLVETEEGRLQVFDPAQRLCWTSPTASTGGCTTPASDATSYTYDSMGNRTEMAEPDGSTTGYEYDQENRLIQVQETGPAPISTMAGQPVVGDFDADGHEDVFWYRPGSPADLVTWGDTRDEFGRSSSAFAVSGTYEPLTGDFDGDGHEDIFWYGPGGVYDSVWFWFGRTDGGYESQAFPVGGSSYRPVAGDFDGDGFSDVYWYAPGATADYIWWGNAGVDTGSAFTSQAVSVGDDHQPVAGDFDNNGFDDIVWYTPGSGADMVYFGAGGRNVWIVKNITISGTYDLIVGDFNGGGLDDLLFYSESGQDTLWWGSQAATFGPTGEKQLTIGPGFEPAAGDFDGDGRDDLLLYSPSDVDTVWWGALRVSFGTDADQKGLVSDPYVSTYSYGTDGLRVAKVVDGATTSFSWDRSGGLPVLLSQHSGAGVTRVVYGPGSTPLYQVNPDGSVSYYHQDRLGSVRVTTDSSGTVVTSHAYDAYGVETAATGAGFRPLLGYAGEFADAETGFLYLRARYYDPTTGQFITKDPLNVLTEDPYTYAAADPVNNTDPFGLLCIAGHNSDGSCRGSGAIQEMREAAGDAAEFGFRKRDVIASIMAGVVCLGTLGTACVVATAIAVGFRSEVRFREHGVNRDTVRAAAFDVVLSFMTIGLLRAPGQLATGRLVDPLVDAVPVVSGRVARFLVESGPSGVMSLLGFYTRQQLDSGLDC